MRCKGFYSHFRSPEGYSEKLTEIINILLTNLTRDILKFNGTVDKYMGDCIIAFWNAPLKDDQHASNSVEAAKRMMKTIETVNAQVKKDFELTFDLENWHWYRDWLLRCWKYGFRSKV